MKALILVDIQYDFLPSGSLPVPEGDLIIPIVNELQNRFEIVFATQDWHPKKHKSFASQHNKQPGEVITLKGIEQILWPDHCVQDSMGAELVGLLNRDKIEKIFRKGTDVEIDSYSGFFDNDHKLSTGLGENLKKRGVREVFIVGLALDYCVKYTAMDAQDLGFKTNVVIDASRAVNINESDADLAVTDMKNKGIKILESEGITF